MRAIPPAYTTAGDTSTNTRTAPADGAASIHLDALRGVAAFWVFLSHWRDCLFVDYPDVHPHHLLMGASYLATGLGHQWVVVFFVLSGYLVGGSVLRQMATDRWSLGGYALKRLTRLYAVLIPALILGGLLDMLGLRLFGTTGIYGGQTGAHEIAANVASRLTLPIAAGNYAFLQSIYVPFLGSNGPLWSLSYEFWYYLAFPLAAFAFLSRLPLHRRAISLLLFGVVIAFIGKDVAALGLLWLMGVAIHWLPRKTPATALWRRVLPAVALMVAIGTLAASKAVHLRWSGFTHFVPSDLVLGIAVTTLVYAILCCSRGRLPVAYTGLAQHAAKSSYTLYLVHVPALVFLTAWIGQPRWQPNAAHVLLGLAIMAAVFLYAQIIYYCFEKHTDSLRVWLQVRLTNRLAAAPRIEATGIPEITS